MGDYVLPRIFFDDVNELAWARAEMFRGELDAVCESPIEFLFGVSLMMTAFLLGIRAEIVREGIPPASGSEIMIYPQKKVGAYRADFYLHTPSGSRPHVIVECDGHDYHERTKEQAIRDRSRDRFMVAAGYAVLRFTGSELYAAPLHRALETLGVIELRRGQR